MNDPYPTPTVPKISSINKLKDSYLEFSELDFSSEAYLIEPKRTTTMEPLSSIVDVWLGSKYTSSSVNKILVQC